MTTTTAPKKSGRSPAGDQTAQIDEAESPSLGEGVTIDFLARKVVIPPMTSWSPKFWRLVGELDSVDLGRPKQIDPATVGVFVQLLEVIIGAATYAELENDPTAKLMMPLDLFTAIQKATGFDVGEASASVGS